MASKGHKRVNRIVRLPNHDPISLPNRGDNAGLENTSNLWEHYNRNFNSLGYDHISVIALTSSTEDSAAFAFETEGGLPPRRKNNIFADTTFAPQGQYDYNHTASQPIKGVFVHQDSTPGYAGKANWIYGDAIRIHTNGAGAGERFIDSDVFRGGATEAQMREDSTWSDFGGIIAATTDSAPDITFRTTTWDSSPDWSTHTYLMTNASNHHRTRYYPLLPSVNFRTAQNIVPFEYDSSEIQYSQAAFDSAEASGGGGGGGGAVADPESWS